MDACDRTGGLPPIVPALDRAFRERTAAGAQAVRDGRLARARACHRAASAEADALFARAEAEGGPAVLIAPMAVTVAALNRADLERRGGAPDRARTILEAAGERLLAAAACASIPLALRLNCLRHLRHALHALADLDHAEGGPGDGDTPLAARTAEVGAEVVRVARALRGEAGASARPVH